MNGALRKHAAALNTANVTSKDQTVYGEDHNVVAMAGEFELSQFLGMPVNLKVNIGGDGGKDNRVFLEYTVNVKTARTPKYLIVKPKSLGADIFVLAAYNASDDTAELVGWEWGHVVARTELLDYCGLGYPPTHGILAEKLRDMDELESRMLTLCTRA